MFLGFGIQRLKISQNIFSTLPKDKSFQQFNNFIENRNISNQVVFSIAVSDKNEDVEIIVNSFSDSLTALSKNYLSEIVSKRPDVEQQVYAYFFTNFPDFIDSSYYNYVDNKLSNDSIKSAVNASYRQLTGPGSAFLKKFILNDPLGVSTKFFKNLGVANTNKNITVEDGIVYNKDKSRILITAKTTFSSDNSANNVKLHDILTAYKTRWNATHSQNSMDYFGTFEIAAENAIQIKKDTLTTVTITIAALILILFLYYRKLSIPVYFILPPVFGGIFAIGIVGYIKPEISAISLATGAVLLGIILDYSFHFFTHLRHTRSISTTVKEISMPLVTGSFTTITAFSALQFANSVVLQDFGLFAALSLSGAAIFTLIFLPVLLKLTAFNYKNLTEEPAKFKMPSVPRKYRYIGLGFVIVLTFIFLFFANTIQFDGGFENMSFHSEDLKNKEQELTGVNPSVEKTIYFFVSDKNYESATDKNYKLFQQIELLRKKGEIRNILSAGQFLVPEKVKKERQQKWINYWSKKEEGTVATVAKAGESLGFNKDAFDGFKTWVERKETAPINADSLFALTGMNNLVDVTPGKTTFITRILVGTENVAKVKAQLQQVEGVEIFDRAGIASSLLELVKNDFNYILLLSALIVFCTLLLIYGRIELALFAFFPMLVSWIWIIGIAAMLGFKFNFVNVVIATFIFGLGDDYSIFVTDALLSKYKYGKKTLGSHSSAIILSALCTIIGTGVLIFAKHPAIHSVALISVLGISIILFISLIFQPILFELFVQERVDNKKAPIPLYEFLISLFEFSYWIFVCLSFYIIGFILILLPFTKKTKAFILNNIISFFAWSVMYLGINVRKRKYQMENLNIKKPSIIISNHGSFLDILVLIMLNPRIIILVKEWVYKSPLFGIFIRYAGYVYTQKGTEQNLKSIKTRIDDGYSIVIFPEGKRSEDGEIGRFHKGAFYLAEELKLDITPILIHGASYVLPKGDYIVKTGPVNLKVLPRIEASDSSWGVTYNERAKNIAANFKIEYTKFKNEHDTESLLKSRIFYNYVFKGPVLEWYIKLKWKFESKNFEDYNEIIGNKNAILDLGCGYGYLPLYLHYRNKNRKITGIDYDDEKIEIAKNNFDKNDNLQYYFSDVKAFHYGKQDVIFINDVLHYLNEEDQLHVLNKSLKALNEKGILIIRDGITDLQERHATTKMTELFSTKILKFNKKENELHFFSSDFIREFAEENKLTFEMKEQSKKTSNMLFILRKN